MIKQVIVIRTDLNMRKGKMIAQGAHASMKVFFDRIISTLESYEGFAKEYDHYKCKFTDSMIQWMEGSFTKIVVGCSSEEELFELQKKADELKIVNAIILDNGATEFHGEKTFTCIAIGPDLSEKIDKITGHLKLL